MDLADLIIIILLLPALARGLRAGLMQLLLSSGGFLAGLLLGSQIAARLAPLASSPLAKLVIVLITEFGLASLFGAVGDRAGLRLSRAAEKFSLGGLNQALGAVVAAGFTLVVVWLAASALSGVHSYGIGGEVKKSLIIRNLNKILPTPPDIFAELEKIISPNGFPNVFLGLEPQHTTISPFNSVNNQAVLNDEASVVKVEGQGCGGLVFGSGFVAAKGFVVTNAHVVAGIDSPEVVDRLGTYRATPVWFDPDMDIAVLRVRGLGDPPLALTTGTLPDGDAAAVLGFPGGGPLVAAGGVIIDHVSAEGRNIYNQGLVTRNIYEAQADVEPGNSGGPLIAPDGAVAGVVFARSLSQNNVGYALMISEVRPLIRQAINNDTPVSTAGCAPD